MLKETRKVEVKLTLFLPCFQCFQRDIFHADKLIDFNIVISSFYSFTNCLSFHSFLPFCTFSFEFIFIFKLFSPSFLIFFCYFHVFLSLYFFLF